MPKNKTLGFILIIAFTLIGLLLTRIGISYLLVLLLIGLGVSFLSKSKLYAILTGMAYAIVSYIITYPAGLFLAQYMPTSSVVIKTNPIAVAMDLLMGALIPTIFAIIICGISAVIGAGIANYIRKDNSDNENKSDGYHFDVEGKTKTNNKNNSKRNKTNKGKFMNPIQKAKMKKQNEE
ncbi:MAG: hypothetical protein E7Z84_01825 [Methanosphaera stadtmanae]|nr:hypothetical protein [Methanosphaera stadtmanae]